MKNTKLQFSKRLPVSEHTVHLPQTEECYTAGCLLFSTVLYKTNPAACDKWEGGLAVMAGFHQRSNSNFPQANSHAVAHHSLTVSV